MKSSRVILLTLKAVILAHLSHVSRRQITIVNADDDNHLCDLPNHLSHEISIKPEAEEDAGGNVEARVARGTPPAVSQTRAGHKNSKSGGREGGAFAK